MQWLLRALCGLPTVSANECYRRPPGTQAHGAGVLLHGGTYYWYGEDKSKPQIKDR